MSYDKYGKLEHINPDTLSPGEKLAFEAWINTSYVTGFTAYKEAFFAGKSCPDAKPLIEALENLITDVKSKPNYTRYATSIKRAEEAIQNYNHLT